VAAHREAAGGRDTLQCDAGPESCGGTPGGTNIILRNVTFAPGLASAGSDGSLTHECQG